MAQINFRVFASTADPGKLERLRRFFQNEMDDKFPHIQVEVARKAGKPIYQDLETYLTEVQQDGHATQGNG